MVWNTESSPLYRSVEAFNSAAEKTPEPACECGGSPQPEKRQPPPVRKYSQQGGILQKLTSDRDSLLIIALIVLLLNEKADMKLIAALAFILLG